MKQSINSNKSKDASLTGQTSTALPTNSMQNMDAQRFYNSPLFPNAFNRQHTLSTAGTGNPVPPNLNSATKSLLNFSASNVRIHSNIEGDKATASIGAAAYSRGNDIVVRRRHLQPGSPPKEKILAHELVHQAQRQTGSQSSLSMTSRIDRAEHQANQLSNVLVGRGPAKPQGLVPLSHNSVARFPEDEVASDTAPSTSYSSTDVTAMTNRQLLTDLRENAQWLESNGMVLLEWGDRSDYQQRMETELATRVTGGHGWLAEARESGTLPESLRFLSQSGERTDVSLVDANVLLDSGGSTQTGRIISEASFNSLLSENAIPTISADTYIQMRLMQEMMSGEAFASDLDTAPSAASSPFDASAAEAASTTVAGNRAYRSLLDTNLMSPYARPISGASGGEIMKWRGRFGEAGYMSTVDSGFGLSTTDLNMLNWTDRNGVAHTPAQESYPLFDFERTGAASSSRVLGAARVSVKTSLRATPAARYRYYLDGMRQMMDASGRTSMGTYINNRPEFAGTPATGPAFDAARSTVVSEAFLAVNADDVGGFRTLLADPTGAAFSPGATGTLWNDAGVTGGPNSTPSVRAIYGAEMRENPVTLETPTGPRTYNSPDALDTALSTGEITPAQHQETQRRVGRGVARRTLSAGVTTAEVTSLRATRLATGLTEPQLTPLLTPEYMSSVRMGGGVGGELRAAGGAGLRGAGPSALIAVFTAGGMMLIDEAEHPDWERELAVTGGMGALGGGIGSASEQAIVSGGTRFLINRTAAGTAPTWLGAAGLGRFGRMGGAGIGAGATELFSMGFLEDRPISAPEASVRTTRAFVLGVGTAELGFAAGTFAGTVATSALAGTALGTAVPGLGNAVGFIIGLGVGIGAYMLADHVVPGGREDWEAAASDRPLPTFERWSSASGSGGFNSPMLNCFLASTPIRLADGSEKSISQLAIGDSVLSYNEVTNRIEARCVEAVHAKPPCDYLELTFDNGRILAVTPMHKLLTPQGWKSAIELEVNNVVYTLTENANEKIPGELQTSSLVTRDFLPALEGVYDLTISTTHTYFANSVLAHNKLP